MTSLPLIATGLVLALTIVLGLMSARKAKTLSDYWVAGRSVGVFTNASAIASNYLSAASFLGVAAVVWASGFDGVWYATGFAAGYILLLLFIASPLRRFGKYTIPDFCQGRFNSKRLRQAGILWAMVISALYIIAQRVGVGTIEEGAAHRAEPDLTPLSLGNGSRLGMPPGPPERDRGLAPECRGCRRSSARSW